MLMLGSGVKVNEYYTANNYSSLLLFFSKAINVTTCLEGDVRLVNGQNQFEGRVEICRNNIWGTVCHNSWSTVDASVLCRQLGYGTDGEYNKVHYPTSLALSSGTALSSAYFGQGTGPIQISNVGCNGLESTLLQCSHITSFSCGHNQDAGARCSAPGNIVYLLCSATIDLLL